MMSFLIATMRKRSVHVCLFLLSALCLLSCQATVSNTDPTTTEKIQDVNGFGIAANHVHSLFVRDHTLLLATHHASYRSSDSGVSWTQVTGGEGQLMQGLMDYSLTASSVDTQRLYMLTQPSVNAPKGIPGLYTSTDQGKTWRLVQPTTAFKTNNLYLVEAGNASGQQVYMYLPAQGAQGLKVSNDAGVTFVDTGKLPFGRILGVVALPGKPGHLLAYSTDGVARSIDEGKTWEIVKDVQGGIYSMVAAGPGKAIYASGDAGVYRSGDGGKSFKLVNSDAAYGSLVVAPNKPEVLYGKTGTAIYRSADSGKTWQALPALKGNYANLAVDPKNADQLYLSLSYPVQIYRFEPQKKSWVALTPELKK